LLPSPKQLSEAASGRTQIKITWPDRWEVNPRVIYDLLFRTSAETLLEIARDPKHLGAEIGFFSVLHTWNQKLQLHPHVHCVVPAGGPSFDHSHWIRSHHTFFLPVKVLGRVFRGKFVAALQRAFQDGQLDFHGGLQPLSRRLSHRG
jgi:hypothetical protein